MSDSDDDRHDRKCVRVRLTGRVQGVWFRGWTLETARDLGVDGWVRNRSDGTVEAVISGAVGAVDEMVRLCHDGPTHARVDRVDMLDEPDYEGQGFEPRPTV